MFEPHELVLALLTGVIAICVVVMVVIGILVVAR